MENGRSIFSLIIKVLGVLLLAAVVAAIVLAAVIFAACNSAFH